MVTASNQIAIVAGLQDRVSKPMEKIAASTARLEKQFTKLSGAFQNAFQFYVRFRIFGLINRAISSLEQAIPSLIARGQEWAQTVDRIADSTGLAAGRASVLAGVWEVMTGDVEGATRALGALAQQVANHEDVLKRYGIETRNANGELLDTWTILMRVNKAAHEAGNSFLTTALARDLLSRGGQNALDFLTMAPEAFKLIAETARESGIEMTKAGLAAADQWGRTQRLFEQQITGIANQITMGVQPLLTRLVDGLRVYLKENMAAIVGFVVRIVAFLAGVVAGFLDIDLDAKSLIETVDELTGKENKRRRGLGKDAVTRPEQVSAEDRYTASLNRQIDAIDRQLAAMAKRERAEDARREQARLLAEIAEAKKELSDLRGRSIFAAGMSAAEAELARQAQAADIIEQQERITEAERKLRDQRRKDAREERRTELLERKATLQERLADHIKALRDESVANREALGQIFDPKGGAGKIAKNIREVMRTVKEELGAMMDGKTFGEGLKESMRDALSHLQGLFEDLKREVPKWIDTLRDIGRFLQGIFQKAQDIIELAGGILDKLTGGDGEGGGDFDFIQTIVAGLAVLSTKKFWLPIIRTIGGSLMTGAFSIASTIANLAFDELGINERLRGSTLGPLALPRQALNGLMNLDQIQSEFQGLEKSIGDAWGDLFGGDGGDSAAKDIKQTKNKTGKIVQTLAPVPGDMGAVARNTEHIASSNMPWGIANITLNVDGKALLRLAGIPIRRGTSTTRVSPSQA